MTLVGRTIVRSDGYVGSPGYNILHWTGGIGAGPESTGGVEEFHDTLETAFLAVAGYLVTGVTFTIESDVAYFDDSDGVIIGSTLDPVDRDPGVGSGSGTQTSRATQIVCATRTAEYVNGRRLQGRFFLGPAAANGIGGDGQITTGAKDDIADNFAGLITGLGGRLAVWHRPTNDPPTNGTYGDVTSLTVRGTPGTLRSRKT